MVFGGFWYNSRVGDFSDFRMHLHKSKLVAGSPHNFCNPDEYKYINTNINSSPNHKFIQTCVIWRKIVALHENTALDKGGERMEVDLQVIIVQNP